MGVIYTKRELEKLVELHMVNIESEIDNTDTTLLKGALKFSSYKVKDIMTERLLRGAGGFTQVYMLVIESAVQISPHQSRYANA